MAEEIEEARARLRAAQKALDLDEDYHQKYYLDKPGWTHTPTKDKEWEQSRAKALQEFEAAKAALASAEAAAPGPAEDDSPF